MFLLQDDKVWIENSSWLIFLFLWDFPNVRVYLIFFPFQSQNHESLFSSKSTILSLTLILLDYLEDFFYFIFILFLFFYFFIIFFLPSQQKCLMQCFVVGCHACILTCFGNIGPLTSFNFWHSLLIRPCSCARNDMLDSFLIKSLLSISSQGRRSPTLSLGDPFF